MLALGSSACEQPPDDVVPPSLDVDTETITGSQGCRLPEGASVPILPSVGSDSDDLFADDALPLFELELGDEVWEQICLNARAYADFLWSRVEGLDVPRQRHAYAEASMVFQGREFSSVGVRFRGRTTVYALFYEDDELRPDAMERCYARTLGRKPSLKIKLDEFGLDEEIADQQKLNLVAREGADSSYLREVLAQRITNDFGATAPRAGHGRVCIDGQYEGVYSLVEEADTNRFKRQRFSDASGGYWKVEADGDQVWRDSWDTNGNWEGDYHPVGDTSETDPGTLRDLLLVGREIAEGGDAAAIDTALDDLIDAEAWMREIAVELAIPDYDGMFGNHKNHLLYDHPERGFVVVPYDRDLAFVDLTEYAGGLCPGDVLGGHPCWASTREGPAIARWLVNTRTDEYLALVEELIETVYVPEELHAWIEARATALRPWVAADRYYREDSPACIDDPEACGYYNLGAWEYSVAPRMLDIISGRWEEVRRQLDGGAACSQPCEDW